MEPRRHRRREPWRDHDTGEVYSVGDAEYAATADAQPALVLAWTLSADSTFCEWVESVRDGSATVEDVAAAYVRREGRPRDVMRHFIREAAESPVSDVRTAVAGVATFAVFVHGSAPQTRWPQSRSMRGAAALVARLGAGQCLACGAKLAQDGARRRYCSPHERTARVRADQEAMLRLLKATADALGVS